MSEQCPYCPSRWCDCGQVEPDWALDDAAEDAERFEPDDLNDSNDWEWEPQP